jgi:hypothetical protein
LRSLMIGKTLNSPWTRDEVAPGLSEPITSCFQRSTFWTIHLELELVDLGSNLIFALLSRGVEIGISVQDPRCKSVPVG